MRIARQNRARKCVKVWFVALAVALFATGAGSAFADTYHDPTGMVVSVGTEGDNVNCQWYGYTREPLITLSQGGGCSSATWGTVASDGGCASGGVVVAIGEANRDCGYHSTEANAGLIGVGLLGADSSGLVAVSDTGDAWAYCYPAIPWGPGCSAPGFAASGTGTATGEGNALSGTGRSNSTWWTPLPLGLLSVSGTQDANSSRGGAVSVTGNATGGGGLGAVTVDGNSNANGGLVSISVLGHARGGNVNYGGSGAG